MKVFLSSLNSDLKFFNSNKIKSGVIAKKPTKNLKKPSNPVSEVTFELTNQTQNDFCGENGWLHRVRHDLEVQKTYIWPKVIEQISRRPRFIWFLYGFYMVFIRFLSEIGQNLLFLQYMQLTQHWTWTHAGCRPFRLN